MQASYIFDGVTHTDFSDEYMTVLGMDDEQKEFTLALRESLIKQECEKVRAERDDRLLKARGWLDRHRDETALGIEHALDATEQELLIYIQALRDVPQQEGFPYHVEWPALK